MSSSRRDNRQEQELRSIIDTVPGNDVCADCETPNPRWASYSLGVFLCTRCASIHRKNSDMSKVKSISLDSWQPEQIRTMREVGNTISNYKYNPLREWPIQEDDQTMERFIQDKYERKKFMSQRETANFTPVKSAMKGSSVPVLPQSSSAVIKYSKELDQLREMGFTDRARNVDVLKSVMGDVASATDVLVAMESTDGKAPPKKPERPRVRFTEDTIGGLDTPHMETANPFAMFMSNAGPSQAAFQQNSFSSIPPSLYHNMNSQSVPFMGNDPNDTNSQGYVVQPVAPLRQQLTGGQPLRPQLQQAPAHAGVPQPQPQLVRQSTGYPQQNQQYQQPNLQFSEPAQQAQPFQASTQPTSYLGEPNPFSNAAPPRPDSTQSATSFGVGSGIRPAFKPTVDLNAPFGFASQSSQTRPFQNQSPQGTGPQQRIGQPSGPFTSTLVNHLQPQSTGVSPQHSGPSGPRPNNDPFGTAFTSPLRAELSNMQQPQNSNTIFNRPGFQPGPFTSSMSPQNSGVITGLNQSQSQSQQGLFNQSSHQSTGMYAQATGPQGYMNNSSVYKSTQPPNHLYQQHTGPQGYPMKNASGSFNCQLSQQNTGGQSFGTNNMPSNPAFPTQQPMQNVFAQHTGASQFPNPSASTPQNNFGGSFQQPFAPTNPQNSYNPQPGQQPQQNQFQQPTGFRPQMTGGGINPNKPFDKSSIMSLYGGNQPQQQQFPPPQQQQQQQQPMYMQPQPMYQQQGYPPQQQQQSQNGAYGAYR